MRLKRKLFQSLLLLSSLVLSVSALAKSSLNMPVGVTPMSHDIYDLHMTILWICVVIGVIVFGVMGYSLVMHRKSRGHQAAQFHENTWVEIIWAVVPFLILVVMAVPATTVLYRMYDDSNPAMTIKITGYQWKWEYQYLNEGISFFSNLSTPYSEINNKQKKNKWYLLEVDHPLVVPIHKKIRFLITSNDVIHSWWVPAFGVKKDALPGFINEAWARINKPGIYRGQCAELCGIHHGFMPIVVIAKTEKDYQAWLKKQKSEHKTATTTDVEKKWTSEELMKLGKQRYDTYCAVCHKVDGSGMPPTFPALAGSSVATGKPISRHIDIILDGIPGTAMQAFGKQLNDVDIAAITTYERNAWSNNTGDVVEPSDVAKRRAVQRHMYTSEELKKLHNAKITKPNTTTKKNSSSQGEK